MSGLCWQIYSFPRGMGVYNEPVLAGESEMLTSS